MNYYFDVKLNFQEKLYKYFEWDENDSIITVNKIPIIKVSFPQFLKVYTGKIKIEKELLDKIKIPELENSVKGAAIFTDSNNSCAISFGENSESIGYSSLSYDDEINIHKVAYRLKKEDNNIEFLENIKHENTSRVFSVLKTELKKEINYLIESKNYLKIKYMYNDLYHCNENNIDKIIDEIYILDLTEMSKIYELLKRNYKEV